MTCCFTGHRDFSWGEDKKKMEELSEKTEQAIDAAVSKGVRHFICGNAIGVDSLAAQMVLDKKKENPKIFLEIAVPFENHNADVTLCRDICKKADLVHVVSDAKDRRSAFYERNRYMVDNSDLLIAVYEPKREKSGTAHTIRYAETKGLEIIRIVV